MNFNFNKAQGIFGILLAIVTIIAVINIIYIILKKTKNNKIKNILIVILTVLITNEVLTTIFKQYESDIRTFSISLVSYLTTFILVLFYLVVSNYKKNVKIRLLTLLSIDTALLVISSILELNNIQHGTIIITVLFITFSVITALSFWNSYNNALSNNIRMALTTTLTCILSVTTLWLLTVLRFSFRNPIYIITFISFFVFTQISIQLLRKISRTY